MLPVPEPPCRAVEICSEGSRPHGYTFWAKGLDTEKVRAGTHPHLRSVHGGIHVDDFRRCRCAADNSSFGHGRSPGPRLHTKMKVARAQDPHRCGQGAGSGRDLVRAASAGACISVDPPFHLHIRTGRRGSTNNPSPRWMVFARALVCPWSRTQCQPLQVSCAFVRRTIPGAAIRPDHRRQLPPIASSRGRREGLATPIRRLGGRHW